MCIRRAFISFRIWQQTRRAMLNHCMDPRVI